ncbi:DNA repair protein RadC [Sphingopyxis sp. OPL5]|uniref:JAB domain-containing protein n=1 Tax=Sphingopyxis sp. OPL5 TaxID=2486273 RepID=UPI00164E4FC4|nr:JAB domain-containing protein [Sphingopyxis sp. OPL5]QNO26625.1 DNA repair protein RadC [Sphingopyxis sp. OPL5]
MTRYETIEAPGAQPASPGFVPRDDEEELPRLLLRPCFPVDGEILLIAGFDAFDRLLCLERAESDRAGRCIVPPPVWRAALETKPAQIVMAHNHPSGIARPSDADLAATRESTRFLALLGVTLSDHMIFTADGHFSFWRAGLL